MITNPRRHYFNSLAADWDHIPATPNSAGRISRFFERSHIAGVRRILDVGCGTGILVPDLLILYGSATSLVEFDLAEDMLRVNSTKYLEASIGRVCADAQTMPFSDACFDLAGCGDHRTPAQALREGGSGLCCRGHKSDRAVRVSSRMTPGYPDSQP